ncbi:hypothetical protein ACOSQ4_017394 [Xanthoceras sorbifolium]
MENIPQAPIDIEDRSNEALIDIENLATSLNEELETLHLLLDDEKAYTSQVVSIGPLHHHMDKLRLMDEHKRRYHLDFLQRTEANRLRNSFVEDIKLSSNEFVKMILVDVAFIIEVLLKNTFCNLQNRNNRIFTKPWMIADIMYDTCLLKNQLPFFILEDLFAGANISMSSKYDNKPPHS